MDCLVIIDMQKDFHSNEDTVNYIKEFLVNNSKKYKLIFTLDEHSPDNYDEYQESKIYLPHCMKGTAGAEIVDDLKDFKEDENSEIFYKDTFGSYDLAGYLWDLCRVYEELDTVTLMGVCTDICVLNNALLIRSTLPETRIIVDAAGCNGTSPKMHRWALALMKANAITVINENKEETNMNKFDFKTFLIAIVVVIAIAFAAFVGIQSSQNHAISLEEIVEVAQSDISVQEKRRIDLIGNLVDCVKEYDAYEGNTLESIVKERGQAGDISGATTAIAAIAEAYPELKSDENYKALMNELSITENMIAQYRSSYNDAVKNYNRFVRKFPDRIFLSLTGYEIIEYDYLDYDAPVDAPQNLFD